MEQSTFSFLLSLLFFKCFSDVFRVGVWSDLSLLDDPELSKLTPDLMDLQIFSSLRPQFQNMYLAAMSNCSRSHQMLR